MGAIVYFGFFTTVICTPFCQLWNIHGPLETGTEFSNALFMSGFAATALAWRTPLLPGSLRSVCQSANTFLKTTVPFLPAQLTDLMSSIPERVSGLLVGLIHTCHVAFQSAHVTGVPSLQFAFGLNSKLVVSGLFLTSFGGPVKRRVTHCPLLLRI